LAWLDRWALRSHTGTIALFVVTVAYLVVVN